MTALYSDEASRVHAPRARPFATCAVRRLVTVSTTLRRNPMPGFRASQERQRPHRHEQLADEFIAKAPAHKRHAPQSNTSLFEALGRSVPLSRG